MEVDHGNLVRMLFVILVLVAISLAAPQEGTLGWPPELDNRNPDTKSLTGRKIERYVHGSRPSWGYPVTAVAEWAYPPPRESGDDRQNHNSFYVVSPVKPGPKAPLYVVLHSASRTAFDYLGWAFLNRKVTVSDDQASAMTNVPDEFYGLYLNSTDEEWWGWGEERQSSPKSMYVTAPGEVRVLDTIEWVVDHYKIDRNRIYLAGVSMGGSGTLAIGMSHGDVFAAIRATVPAGTDYASYLMGGFGPWPEITASAATREAWIRHISRFDRPEPPIIVDFSAQNDTWAVTQSALLQAAQVGRLPLIMGWGAFGHTPFASHIGEFGNCEVVLAFPWLQIRKDEAYPVFTHASSDQRSPWLNAPVDYDQTGQINAYFRWKVEVDESYEFRILLWMDNPRIKNSVDMPKSSTANVTLRRLQHLYVGPSKQYQWKLLREARVVGEGVTVPDSANLLTIQQVNLSTKPIELMVKPD